MTGINSAQEVGMIIVSVREFLAGGPKGCYEIARTVRAWSRTIKMNLAPKARHGDLTRQGKVTLRASDALAYCPDHALTDVAIP